MAGVRRARRRFPVRTVLVVLALGVIVTALVVSVQQRGDRTGDDQAAEPPAPVSTPLSDLDTSEMTLTRGDFCALVAPAAVEDVLGGAPESSDSYANGDATTYDEGRRDVAHEFGCTWTAAEGTTARAWIFAPPVTRERARELRAAAVDADRCTRARSGADFGEPSVAVRCTTPDGVTITYQGLFGDAWLSCSVTTPARNPQNLLARTGTWCVSVAQAAAS